MKRIVGGCYVVGINLLFASAVIVFGLAVAGGRVASFEAITRLGSALIVFSLPFVPYYFGESVPRPIYLRLLWTLLSFIVATWKSHVLTGGGGVVFYFALVAIVLPSLWLKNSIAALFGGLFSGAIYFLCCLTLKHFYIPVNDDWMIMYPYVLGFVSLELAAVRFVINRTRRSLEKSVAAN